MKNKRLVAILCVLGFLTVLIIINSTLFTLQSVSINWLTSKSNLQGVKDYQIAEEVELGQSIFLVNKSEVASTLEKANPYLRVVSIETKFPNKIVIHSAERESLYAIKLSDTEYAVLDEMGKVLSITNGSVFDRVESNFGKNPILINFDLPSLSLSTRDFRVGEMVDIKYIVDTLSIISRSLREARYVPTTSKGVISNITISQQSNDSSRADITTRCGIVLSISGIEVKTTDKLRIAFAQYNYYHNLGAVDCEIAVFVDPNTGEVVADPLWE